MSQSPFRHRHAARSVVALATFVVVSGAGATFGQGTAFAQGRQGAAPPVMTPATPTQAAPPTQSVDDIIAKNLAAKGGLDRLRKIETIRQSGSLSAPNMQAQFVSVSKRPNLTRQEITAMGQKMIMVFDGTKAWMLNPMTGPEAVAMPDEVADMTKDQSDIDGPLVDYKDKGSTIELAGTETLNGRSLIHLRVLRKTPLPRQDVYLDAKTFLEAKVSTTLPGSGAMDILFDDYRTVDGLTLPFSIKNVAGGVTTNELKIDKVEINGPVRADEFKIK